jgi:hypothetical protein
MICSSTRLLHLERWGVESIHANLLMQSVLVCALFPWKRAPRESRPRNPPSKESTTVFHGFGSQACLRILQGIRSLVVNFLLSGALFGVLSDETDD